MTCFFAYRDEQSEKNVIFQNISQIVVVCIIASPKEPLVFITYDQNKIFCVTSSFSYWQKTILCSSLWWNLENGGFFWCNEFFSQFEVFTLARGSSTHLDRGWPSKMTPLYDTVDFCFGVNVSRCVPNVNSRFYMSEIIPGRKNKVHNIYMRRRRIVSHGLDLVTIYGSALDFFSGRNLTLELFQLLRTLFGNVSCKSSKIRLKITQVSFG